MEGGEGNWCEVTKHGDKGTRRILKVGVQVMATVEVEVTMAKDTPQVESEAQDQTQDKEKCFWKYHHGVQLSDTFVSLFPHLVSGWNIVNLLSTWSAVFASRCWRPLCPYIHVTELQTA